MDSNCFQTGQEYTYLPTCLLFVDPYQSVNLIGQYFHTSRLHRDYIIFRVGTLINYGLIN